MKDKRLKRLKRKSTIRKSVSGTSTKPRLNIYRSNKHMYAQLVDDETNKTILGLSDVKLKTKGNKTEVANVLGSEFAKLAKSKKIEYVVFDRSGYKYHGRIKKFAEAAKESGLKF